MYHQPESSAPDEWRSVVGFPDYEVSSAGIIRRARPDSFNRAPKTALTASPNGEGYLGLRLYHNRRARQVRVHRVVCEAFHGPAPSERHHAAHRDGDKANNRSSNLRWATPSENMLDKAQHGSNPRGRHVSTAKLSEAQVRAIRSDGRSSRKIAPEYGVGAAHISRIKRRANWGHI